MNSNVPELDRPWDCQGRRGASIYIYVNTHTPYIKYRGVTGAEAHLPRGILRGIGR